MPQDPLTDTERGEPTIHYPGTSTPGMPEIPGYDVVETIGEGGMGIVYKGLHLALNRPVAVKSIRISKPNKQDLDRFLAEARLVASLAHPHVVQVHDYGQSEGMPYLVMEYLSGGTLAESLKRDGRRDPRHAATLVEQVAEGVQQAHEKGIVHRDIKPGNVLFDADGTPKVSDFGLAKRFDQNATVTQGLHGTPLYMAPEQAHGDGRPVGPPADVWSLGVLLYELLTGQTPFVDREAYAVIRKVIDYDPPAPSAQPNCHGVPSELDCIVMKCLRKEPSERYRNAGELATDLNRFLKGSQIVATPSRRRSLPRSVPVPVWMLLAATLLIGGATAEDEVRRRVEAVLRTPPTPDTDSPHPLTPVEKLGSPDMTAFHYLDDERIFDLRNWKPSSDKEVGTVVMKTRQRLLKIQPVNVLTLEARTTGRNPILRAIEPNPSAAVVRTAEAASVVGQQRLLVRHLDIDIREVPINQEFDVRASTTFAPTLERREDRWFGVIGYAGSVKASMLMLFPADRPFTSYKLRVATKAKPTELVNYSGPRIVFTGEGNRWLYWELPHPVEGNVYRIDWEW
jgi:eukaryotic-like serine/threonine-protein kinase